ncbi:hypothetical protein L798_07812 [Zootermopsis nevadensis]|uniref:Small RNA 2'-O-methyltransferase n=1 Tax=Zootermopsis nevadensis TaxID=136037 RepID=A0A067RDI7_ZOONE|nr:hypothetical protein L798_07812 [Zootermopsis nevadensis]
MKDGVGKLERQVVDFGCAEFGIFPYVKHIPGLQEVLSVDIDREMLEHYCCRVAPLNVDYLVTREEPLTVRVLVGSIADRDSSLLGADAVICVELIEHLYPDTLEALPYNVFGFIKPLIAIFTTPNSDFNVLFPDFTGFRNADHKFEWSRAQATNITTRYPAYIVKFHGVGQGPKGTEMYGCCSQMAVFVRLPNYTPAPFAQLTSQHEDLEEEDKYVTMQEYIYPVYVDNRTNEEKILHKAEYYIRLYATIEESYNDVNEKIPLRLLLPHVKRWCTSPSVLRSILKEAGWEILGETQDDEAVLYPCCGASESSLRESEDVHCEGQEELEANPQEPDHWEENWNNELQLPFGYECDNCTSSQFMADISSVQQEYLSDDATQPQFDVHLQRDGDLESSNDSYKNREDDTHASSDRLECSGGVRSYKSTYCIPLRDHSSINNAENIIKSTSEHSSGFSTNLNSTDDYVQSLAGLESELSVEQAFSPCTGHSANKEGIKFSKVGHIFAPMSAVYVESSQKLVLETCSNNEALTDCKSEKNKKIGGMSSLCSFPEDSRVSGEHQKSQYLEHQVTTGQVKGLNASLSSGCMVLNSGSNRYTEKFSNVSQNGHTEESLSVGLPYLNSKREITDCSASQTVINQPLNFGSGSSSMQESSQDRSLVESCSLDEQNDKAADSGYPNSFSVQDMDMDLTPEQVDEIVTENHDDSEYDDSESSGENDHIENNDGLMFQFHHEALYNPMGLVVENGDLANNNSEDFDNDNDLILPGDEPFPHWLLNLLGVANHGADDLQNYMIPPIDGFLLPDEGVGGIDNEDDDSGEPSSVSEMGDIEGGGDPVQNGL